MSLRLLLSVGALVLSCVTLGAQSSRADLELTYQRMEQSPAGPVLFDIVATIPSTGTQVKASEARLSVTSLTIRGGRRQLALSGTVVMTPVPFRVEYDGPFYYFHRPAIGVTVIATSATPMLDGLSLTGSVKMELEPYVSLRTNDRPAWPRPPESPPSVMRPLFP